MLLFGTEMVYADPVDGFARYHISTLTSVAIRVELTCAIADPIISGRSAGSSGCTFSYNPQNEQSSSGSASIRLCQRIGCPRESRLGIEGMVRPGFLGELQGDDKTAKKIVVQKMSLLVLRDFIVIPSR